MTRVAGVAPNVATLILVSEKEEKNTDIQVDKAKLLGGRRASGSRGAPAHAARPWFSGNRQRSGAIKRFICVLQFDPAALGAEPRSESNLREFLGIRVRARDRATWVPSNARCNRRPFAPVVAASFDPFVAPYVDDHHQEDGVRSIVSPIPR